MSNYEERFIALLEEQNKIKKEQEVNERKACELSKAMDDLQKKIDLVFMDIIEEDYSWYEPMISSEGNTMSIKFEHNGKIIEVSTVLKITKPIKRKHKHKNNSTQYI